MKNETIESIIKLTDAKKMVFESLCALQATVGTTGKKGGDSSKGCRTLFQLKNIGASDMRISLDGKEVEFWDNISIVFGGDYELENLISSLKFAIEVLEKHEPGKGYKERQLDCFTEYLNDLIELYYTTGGLNGISSYRNKHGVTGITKVQFFQFHLDNKIEVTREEAAKIYESVKNKKQIKL